MLPFFIALQFGNTVEAATSTTAQFTKNETSGNFYQTTIDFQLSSEGTQMIIYSPDYDKIALAALKTELGTENVIADSSKKQIIVNLKNKVDKNNTGSFIVDMKKGTSDILYIRDINNNEIVNEDLATNKAITQSTSTDSTDSSDSSSANNALTVNNALNPNNALSTNNSTIQRSNMLRSATVSSALTPATAAAITKPIITVNDTTVEDVDKDLTITGTWQSSSNYIDIYYKALKSSPGHVSTDKDTGITTDVGDPGLDYWVHLGRFTGTAGAVNTFQGTIPSSLIKRINAGKQTFFFNYVKPINGNADVGTSYAGNLIIPKVTENMKLSIDGVDQDTTKETPYVARDSTFSVTSTFYTNLAGGSVKYYVDGAVQTAPSVNIANIGIITIVQKINLDDYNAYDGQVHEATFSYVVNGQPYDTTSLYFVVGNQLKLTVPDTISFGSHMSSDLVNGLTSPPDINGQLSLFDGRIGTYSGNLGITTSATTFKNADGDTLNANLSWGDKVLPTDGSGVQIEQMTPPTATSASYRNYTSDVKDNLKLNIPKDSTPKSGTYTSTMTWTVNDTIQ